MAAVFPAVGNRYLVDFVKFRVELFFGSAILADVYWGCAERKPRPAFHRSNKRRVDSRSDIPGHLAES